jgi:hypothetical protein
MGRPSARRFGIIDCMGIVAAAAVAVALARYHLGRDSTPGVATAHVTRSVALPLSWMVVALSSVGRGPGRRRPRPPGVAACVGVIVATGISLSFWVHVVIILMPGVGWAWEAWRDLPWEFIPQQIVDPTPPAIAVGSVWAVLALDRRWRPEPAWLDRLGRILGVYWLADAVGLPIALRVAGYW